MELPSTPSLRLDRKRALVTGASSGIGLACAVALAEAGAAVTLVARRQAALEDVRDALTSKGLSAAAARLDVADLEAVDAFVGAQAPFDVLVNGAGLARHSTALSATVDDFDAVMDVNLRGAFFLTRAVAQKLIDAGKPGSLINISSQMGHVGGVDRAVYCASKHAVEGMTKALAIEFGPKQIRVNTLCPTFIRTPLTEETFQDPERRAWLEEKIKLGRVGQVEDLMGPVVFLASDAAALITGTALLVDGGWTAD